MRIELMRMNHLIAGGAFFLFPSVAFAQERAMNNFRSGLTATAGGAGLLNTTSPGTLVANLINVILGLSGLVLVCFLVYAGILYMQGGSDEKKVQQAKALILNSIIGIVLIISAYAISTFVIEALSRAVSA